MADDRQFRHRTAYVATRGVKEYRAAIPQPVHASDSVLELGCKWGTANAPLASQGGLVIGSDFSHEVPELFT